MASVAGFGFLMRTRMTLPVYRETSVIGGGPQRRYNSASQLLATHT